MAIGLANTYIAKGDDRRAAGELAAIGNAADFQQSYDYQLAWANIYTQRHDNPHAISAFARANQLAADDPTAERGLLQVAGEEGMPLPFERKLNMQTEADSGAIFDDATLYQMSSAFLGAPVPPHSSQQTDVGSVFRYNGWKLPINGIFGLRNYKGTAFIPSQVQPIRRNTFDTVFNAGTTWVQRLGSSHIILTPGLQFTIRRDTQSPVQMDQNLFRQYLYLSTSPFYNWLAVRGFAMHEAGPFTEQNLNSRDLGASVEFQVGRPWGNNSLVTGYSVRDLQFHPRVSEFFTTSTWVGWQHNFGQKMTITGLAKYLRSWRVENLEFAKAQILLPGARVEFKPNDRWSVDGAVDFTRGEGFHLYDNVQTGFLISYMRPLRRSISDGSGLLNVDYPLRFSVGLQQQSFFSYTGTGSTSALRPVFKISIF